MSKFIKIRFDLHCEWDFHCPEYRIYVNDELFTERTFNVQPPQYFKEMLQVQGLPGKYTIRLESLTPHLGNFIISNTNVEVGTRKILSSTEFEIL